MSRGGSCGAWFRRDRAFKTSNGRARRVLDAPGHGAPSCASSDGLEGLYAYPHVTTWLDETLPTIVPISRSELRPIEQWMSYFMILSAGRTSLKPDSKVYGLASRLTASWMQASVMKAARVSARFS